MSLLSYHESIRRGSLDFPLDYHCVTARHPRYEMPYHWHEECEMIYVTRGKFALMIDGAPCPLREGDIAFIGPGRLHGGKPEDCEYECVVFDLRLLLSAGDPCKQYVSDIQYGKARPNARYLADDAPRAAALPMFGALREKPEGYALITLGCLFCFIGEIFRTGAYEKGRAGTETGNALKLKRVFELIEAGYKGALSLPRLSAEVGMSPKYFCRFFRQTTHRTPMEYVRYYRVEQACRQMHASDCNVTEAALDAGFEDVNYFIRAFKRQKGVTPGQYIKRIRNKEDM